MYTCDISSFGLKILGSVWKAFWLFFGLFVLHNLVSFFAAGCDMFADCLNASPVACCSGHVSLKSWKASSFSYHLEIKLLFLIRIS